MDSVNRQRFHVDCIATQAPSTAKFVGVKELRALLERLAISTSWHAIVLIGTGFALQVCFACHGLNGNWRLLYHTCRGYYTFAFVMGWVETFVPLAYSRDVNKALFLRVKARAIDLTFKAKLWTKDLNFVCKNEQAPVLRTSFLVCTPCPETRCHFIFACNSAKC